MKKIVFVLLFGLLTSQLFSQDLQSINLNPPDTNRGLPVMKALSLRSSETEFDSTSLKLQDLSDLLWAANGINRPDGKRTAPSAVNAQDIDIYVFNKYGVYLYNPQDALLKPVVSGDNRDLFYLKEGSMLPAMICVLVSDISRFTWGEKEQWIEWASMDAGIVAQNILIFCASADLASRPRAGMKQKEIKKLLKLKGTQYPKLNVLVSYKKDHVK